MPSLETDSLPQDPYGALEWDAEDQGGDPTAYDGLAAESIEFDEVAWVENDDEDEVLDLDNN